MLVEMGFVRFEVYAGFVGRDGCAAMFTEKDVLGGIRDGFF